MATKRKKDNWLEEFLRPKQKEEKMTAEEFAQYLKDIGANITMIKEIIDNQEVEMNKNDFYDLYKDLKAENRIVSSKIDSMRTLLTILITVFGIFTPLMFSLHARSIDAKFETINKTMESNQKELQNEIKLLRNDFLNLKELNKVEIEKEVLKQTRK